MGEAGLQTLAGLVSRVVYEITRAISNNGGGRVLGLLCVEQNEVDSNLAPHFDFFPCPIFSSLSLAVRICIRSYLHRNSASYPHSKYLSLNLSQ